MIYPMCLSCQQVIEQLNINIDLFFEKLATGENKKQLSELEQEIICQSLLGQSRQHIAKNLNLPEQKIRDRLSNNIYPRIAELMQLDQEQIAGNWVKILNLLLHPNHGYKLNPAPQLNNDNFQGSFGRQIFLYPPNQDIVELQIQGNKFYQQGLYYQALKCFLWAWKKEKEIYHTGNPEVLIYINNCLIEYKQSILQDKKIKPYTLAVVVPFYHNQDQVAAEILRGIAQIQLQINLPSFDKIALEKEINLKDIKPDTFFNLNHTDNLIVLRILIVNDPNNLYAPYSQTAENLADLAPQLNLIAIIGHYSSEMTKKALHFYSQNGLVLINPSSTSNELSHLSGGESLSFFRLTTQDNISARQLAHYLIERFAGKSRIKVAIVYNKNSNYSTSYRNSIKNILEKSNEEFVLLKECNYISDKYYHIQAYLEEIKKDGVEIIIIIPDGGIEPNSLDNAGLISRLKLNKCLIAGSATFYHENVLHWIHEQSQYNVVNQDECQIIACVPWHWHSQKNGCNSENKLGQRFCEIGTQLWGEENLTWRSATAFDSVLIVLRILELYQVKDSQSLLINMNQYFKEQKKQVKGVTGNIEFQENGDRLNPPSEIVAVKWNTQQQKWHWTIEGRIQNSEFRIQE
ncbi:ABC transporter substrate-binding protein [Desmonostoc muscorum LEGE 12446]|uniref:Amino acid ABC transporter substrate-binding protein n=1 Tax=Desmonostoc muscorum LEGE 12446 TaxID=1828758 RepID=A0A8J6ZLL6_DESMC|nr:ABC transporter substrate-binding protein [Desmonostoc muscorum]MCF2149829.1 ABC transporter substrate-binding protein [Desmonostoc muscorum LEGE 12446]